MRPRPTHERDPIDDDGEVLREDRVDGDLVGRQLEDVDAEAADGRHQGEVLLTGATEVDRGVGLERGQRGCQAMKNAPKNVSRT